MVLTWKCAIFTSLLRVAWYMILLLPLPITKQTLKSVLFRAKMACTKMEELRQLQYTMSWLSTLGGAFSALGEGQERCVSINYNVIYTRAFWK